MAAHPVRVYSNAPRVPLQIELAPTAPVTAAATVRKQSSATWCPCRSSNALKGSISSSNKEILRARSQVAFPLPRQRLVEGATVREPDQAISERKR
jgi:hypothetical protein